MCVFGQDGQEARANVIGEEGKGQGEAKARKIAPSRPSSRLQCRGMSRQRVWWRRSPSKILFGRGTIRRFTTILIRVVTNREQGWHIHRTVIYTIDKYETVNHSWTDNSLSPDDYFNRFGAVPILVDRLCWISILTVEIDKL